MSLQQPRLPDGSCLSPCPRRGSKVPLSPGYSPACPCCVLLYQLGPANLLYQRQLTPPASQGVPAVTGPLGRGCCPHAPAHSQGHPEGSWALTHWGVVAMDTSPGDKQWPGACGGPLSCAIPSPASSFAGGPAAAVPLPPGARRAALLHAWAGDQQPPALPLPGTCFPDLGAYSPGRGCNKLLGAGFALLVERMETDAGAG